MGPKVLRLIDGSFLKLFRRRRWYTSGSFNPYSERFAVNSEQLRNMGIPTPHILDLYRLEDGSTAVHYSPLPGNTLRQVLQGITAPAVRQALVERFGKFMAQLHEQGVYFRSLHLGNVLVLEDGEFGLIDLADMRIYPSSLSLSLRQRNLRHMQRYTVDRRWLFEDHFEALLQGYAVTASKSDVDNLHRQVLAGSSPGSGSPMNETNPTYCDSSLPARHRDRCTCCCAPYRKSPIIWNMPVTVALPALMDCAAIWRSACLCTIRSLPGYSCARARSIFRRAISTRNLARAALRCFS